MWDLPGWSRILIYCATREILLNWFEGVQLTQGKGWRALKWTTMHVTCLPVAPAHLVKVDYWFYLPSIHSSFFWYEHWFSFGNLPFLPLSLSMKFRVAALVCSSSVCRCPWPDKSKHSIPATSGYRDWLGWGWRCVSDPSLAKWDAILGPLPQLLGNKIFPLWDG